jgi:hypothetical protein
MGQLVTNEALWVKLSEVEQKLDKLSKEQELPVPAQESAENKLDFSAVKEEIVTKIKDEIVILGRSSDSHFEANRKNIGAITETLQKVWNIVSRIRKQQRETVEPPKEKEFHFKFWFFKVRKTSFAIALLALLVLILTLFCMKQQNDYSLLIDEYYKQGVQMREMQKEAVTVKGRK